MKTFAISFALMLFCAGGFCQEPVTGNINFHRVSNSPETAKNFEHDIALVKPLINTNDPNGGYYQEYWYFSFHSMYCGATVTNAGNMPATHVYLELKIFDNYNVYLHSYFSDTLATLNPGETRTLNIPGGLTFQPWFGVDNLIDHMVFLARSDSLDYNPANNQQTVPFPVLSYYDWTAVSRSANPATSRQIGQAGGFQPGDFIGFTFTNDEYHRIDHLKFYLAAPWPEPFDIQVVLYENGRLLDSVPVFLPSLPADGWIYSDSFFFGPIIADSIYYAGIKFNLPAGSSFSMGADTSAYHNFPVEAMARKGGNWTSLDFVPAMELVCDPEGIGEKETNGPVAFPNPAGNELFIENAGDAAIELFDQAGRLVFTDRQTAPSRVLDVSGVPSGLYLLRISRPGKTPGKKVVIIYH